MTGFPILYGGLACLDFVNSIDARDLPQRRDHLRGYGDLVRWAAYTRMTDHETARHLHTLGAARPPAAQLSLTAALRLREVIFRVLAGDAPPAPADLAVLTQGYAQAMARAELVPAGPHLTWRLAGDHLDAAWWPAAVSAAGLLTAGPRDRVGRCRCGGLFLDVSRNRSRRWCSMDTCGSNAKVDRLAARRRSRSRG